MAARRPRALIRLAVVLLFALSATAVITSYTEGDATAWFLGVALIAGPPALLLLVPLAILGRAAIGGVLVGCIVLAGVPCAVSLVYSLWEANASLAYCGSLVGDLEDYRDAHGEYPAGLDDLDPGPRLKPLRLWFHGATWTCNYFVPEADILYFSVEIAPNECSSWIGTAAEYQRGRLVTTWPMHCEEGY